VAGHRAGLGSWFRLDQNLDESVTITDIWLLAGKIFHAPGDAVIVIFLDHVTKVATFFELSNDSFGGFISGVISFLVWVFLFVIWIIVMLLYDDYHAYSPPGPPPDDEEDGDDDSGDDGTEDR